MLRRRRRYFYSDFNSKNTTNLDLLSNTHDILTNGQELIKIPLPNETEPQPKLEPNFEPKLESHREDTNNISNTLALSLNRFCKLPFFSEFKNLHIDDILLLGIIFLLIQEKVEDEFLLIILLYIFFIGR